MQNIPSSAEIYSIVAFNPMKVHEKSYLQGREPSVPADNEHDMDFRLMLDMNFPNQCYGKKPPRVFPLVK